MSDEKTEEPTQKKLRDSAKKGESYKSRDMVAACIISAGMLSLPLMSFSEIDDLFADFILQGSGINPAYAVNRIVNMFLQLVIPFVGACIVATIIPSLLQSRFVLAFEAVKIDFNSLNPVSGFKKIFNMKTIKEFIKACLYLMIFSAVAYAFYIQYRHVILQLIYAQPVAIDKVWLELGTTVVLLCLMAFLLIILFDGIADYFLYMKNQKMDKHEVKQEYKEQEGSQEIKSRRQELQHELLSAQSKTDIEQSNFILGNPTHIAIGVYLDPQKVPLPFVSILEKDERALAVIAYAEKCNVPVIRDVYLARTLFKVVRPYSFIPTDMLEPILRIMIWLYEVEMAHMPDLEINPEELELVPIAPAPAPEEISPPAVVANRYPEV